MDLFQSMRVFQCVVDEGGFAAAARKMELTPAVVTRQIQDLEQSLGVRLLHRTTRKMSLTQAGEGYLSRLRLILLEIEETAYQAALAGAGLTLLPELALTARPHGGQLHRVLAPWVSVED
ncbi:LysR family transcriptional regulator [Rhodoferax saidenbachensis]|uniref:DNA-binding transcriptional LysR family regulator n=1 Tax=Rhodoferax saidenbachensis TaxID=1484693 RepID=A0ABU1ZM86_9BURK|nr:LysR family transcriptional regulator [Rhodoferax saidenbachensis]MDR7306662.1 DNA-binding transcriptional LysR family regulator [Rhodoferax saidenbachensis]